MLSYCSQSSAPHSYANTQIDFGNSIEAMKVFFLTSILASKTFFFGSARASATVSSLASIEICWACFTYFMFLLFLFFSFSFSIFCYCCCCCPWALFLHFLRIFFECAFPSSHALNYPRSRRALEHPQCGAGHFVV